SSSYDSTLGVVAHELLTRTTAALAVVQLDDLVEERDLVNLPGSTEGYPNWRRRLSVPLEAIEQAPLIARVAALLRETRPALARGGHAGDEARIGNAASAADSSR